MNGWSLAMPSGGQKRALLVAAFAGALWVGHPALALLAGAVGSLALAPTLPSFVDRAGKLCLQGAIVLLGFTLHVQALWQTSREYAAYILIFVLATLIAGLAIGRLVRADEDQARLLSTGTAICGGTAIATLAPIIRARPESVAIAIGIVFPAERRGPSCCFHGSATFLGMTEEQFGVWVAMAIHDTSSVVGAAAIFGDRALEVATTVKVSKDAPLLVPIAPGGGHPGASEPGQASATRLSRAVRGGVPRPAASWSRRLWLRRASRRQATSCSWRRSSASVWPSGAPRLRPLKGRAIMMSVLLWLVVLPVTWFVAMGW